MNLLSSAVRIVGVVSVVLGLSGCLMTSADLQSHPGYADLSLPDRLQTSPSFSLALGPKALIPVRWFVRHAIENSDEAGEEANELARAVLQAVKGVRIRVYEVDNNDELFDTAVNESVSTLKQSGWQTLVTVKEADERVVIMQAGEDELIVGLSVLVINPEEAVFVNIVGELKPDDVVMLADSGAEF
ncbi:MAG: DUF4252 domain-containing protein [Pseudomonadales bacterium]